MHFIWSTLYLAKINTGTLRKWHMWVGYHSDGGLFSRSLESRPKGEGQGTGREHGEWSVLLGNVAALTLLSCQGSLHMRYSCHVTEVNSWGYRGQGRAGKGSANQPQSAGLLVTDAKIWRVYYQDRPDICCVQTVEGFCKIILCRVWPHIHMA